MELNIQIGPPVVQRGDMEAVVRDPFATYGKRKAAPEPRTITGKVLEPAAPATPATPSEEPEFTATEIAAPKTKS